MNNPSDMIATSLGKAGSPIIQMFLIGIMWVSMIGAMWGLGEVAMGNPRGYAKMKMALIAFIGSYVIPMVWFTIDKALRVMVQW
jgi:hypothetical protein